MVRITQAGVIYVVQDVNVFFGAGASGASPVTVGGYYKISENAVIANQASPDDERPIRSEISLISFIFG